VRWAFVAIAAFDVPDGRERDDLALFVRKRGRAIAIASLGQGLSKVLIPIATAALFTWLGGVRHGRFSVC